MSSYQVLPSQPTTYPTTTTTQHNANGSVVTTTSAGYSNPITTGGGIYKNYEVRQQSGGYVSTTGSPTAYGEVTTSSYEQSRRKVSSIVVSSEPIGELPKQDGVRYVEVPMVREVVKHIPRREVIEREKIVPKVEIQYVEKLVEVPQVQYVDKVVEKPEIKENIVYVTRKEIVDVPVDVVKSIPKIETVVVQKVVEVPGPIVEVEKKVIVEKPVPVMSYQDKEVPVVVAQTVQPVVVEGTETVGVDLFEYEPQVVVVDVHVAKPVGSQIIAAGVKDELHRIVQVPAAQYNTILRTLNPHIGASEETLPFMQENGHVPFLPHSEFATTIAPHPNVTIEGYNAPMSTRDVISRGIATHRGNRSYGTTVTTGVPNTTTTATSYGPGYVTTAPGYSTTTAPGYATTTAPGYATTTAPGYVTTTAPGYATTPGYGYGSIVGHNVTPSGGQIYSHTERTPRGATGHKHHKKTSRTSRRHSATAAVPATKPKRACC